MKPESATVQSLARGLRILEWLADSEPGLTLAEVAARLGVSRSTAFNLLNTLVAHGFARKTARPVRYRLGPAPRRLAERARDRSREQRLDAVFRELGRALPDCFLFYCENLGGDLRMTRRRDPALPDTIDHRPAARIVPYGMALSLAYLAFCDDEDRAEYLRAYPFDEYGRVRWGTFAACEKQLAAARRRGFLALTGPPCRVVVPVRGPGGGLAGLLGASYHAGTADSAAGSPVPRLHAALLAAAARIVRAPDSAAGPAPGENAP